MTVQVPGNYKFCITLFNGITLNLPVFEFQHRHTGKQQDITFSVSIAAAKAPINTYRRGGRSKLHYLMQKVKNAMI